MPLPRHHKNRKANRRQGRMARAGEHAFPHCEDFRPSWQEGEVMRYAVVSFAGDMMVMHQQVRDLEEADQLRREIQAEYPTFNNLNFNYIPIGAAFSVPIEIVAGEPGTVLQVHQDNHKLRELWEQQQEEERRQAREVMERARRSSKGKGAMNVQLPQPSGHLSVKTFQDGKAVEDDPAEE